jgi:hypothetical protein
MKKVSILLTLVLLFSCNKKEPTIDWQKDITFEEVLKLASDKYVMIDFIKDG